jgi:hypothetical protein
MKEAHHGREEEGHTHTHKDMCAVNKMEESQQAQLILEKDTDKYKTKSAQGKERKRHTHTPSEMCVRGGLGVVSNGRGLVDKSDHEEREEGHHEAKDLINFLPLEKLCVRVLRAKEKGLVYFFYYALCVSVCVCV